jgi:hypothetical protein
MFRKGNKKHRLLDLTAGHHFGSNFSLKIIFLEMYLIAPYKIS